MTCYHPITAYRSKEGRNPETGKWPIVFNPRDGFVDMPVQVPCGQCIGCRLEHSRQWATRCVFEATQHRYNSFITLTYDDLHLPPDGSLVKRDMQLFMKRLRKKFGDGIRFFGCGEYGSQLQRPHYHIIIFGEDFRADRYPWSRKNKSIYYRSPSLEKLWPYGFSLIGEVTFESCSYVARYVLKKITGDCADAHYQGRAPEFTLMSRRPGIAREWYEQYKNDVYPNDYVVIRNNLVIKPPRYFDVLYDVENHEAMQEIKSVRKNKALENAEDNTLERMTVKEQLAYYKLRERVRNLEQVKEGNRYRIIADPMPVASKYQSINYVGGPHESIRTVRHQE